MDRYISGRNPRTPKQRSRKCELKILKPKRCGEKRSAQWWRKEEREIKPRRSLGGIGDVEAVLLILGEVDKPVARGQPNRNAQVNILGAVDGAGEVLGGALSLGPARKFGAEGGCVIAAFEGPQAVERYGFALGGEPLQLGYAGQALALDNEATLRFVGLLPIKRALFRFRGNPLEHDRLLDE